MLLTQRLRQLALQCAALLAVLSLMWPYYGIRNEELPPLQTAWTIGAVALALAVATRQAWWWWLIHLLFAPLMVAASRLPIAPEWFLLAFIALLLIYRGALRGQIPLYLSNDRTAAALAALTADVPGLRFLDLGAGIGSMVCPLASACPDGHFAGVEDAPIVWLIGRLRTARLGNCDWRWGNLWQVELGSFDVVYAFLSPTPMSALWNKIRQEMRPGSLFISNSFAIPGVDASDVVQVDDARQTRLFCYRL